MNMVALIPARVGSKRCPGKNTRLLGGHPLIAWTIAAAQQSGLFSDITVSTDDENTRKLAYDYGAHGMYRNCGGGDDQPDIEWVRDYFSRARSDQPIAFAILRPTSPFRTAETIHRAYKQFIRSEVHSIRAVQSVKDHPGKVWEWAGAGYPMTPLIDRQQNGVPWHSMPTQSLPKVYVQNSSLEMAWSYVVSSFDTISGNKIAPFFTEGHEGLAIDTEEDWDRAELLVAGGAGHFPAAPLAAALSADPRD